MNILFITQYFTPEIGAAAARIFDIAQESRLQGHTPTVISETPHYPSNAVLKGYRNCFIKRERFCQIQVLRSYVMVSKRENFIQRFCLYISFIFSSIINSFSIKWADLVFASSPPLTVGLAGFVISRIKHAKFVLDVRDLWPESALALGELKQGFVFKLLQKLETYLYHKADLITIAVPGFRNHMKRAGISDDKIFDLPNGANLDLFEYYENRNLLKKETNLDEKFIVLFSGNHGLAQGLESILYVAKDLLDYQDIVFILIGDGVRKKALIQLKDQLRLENVCFFDKVTREALPKYISISDVCLVPLIKHPLFLSALPSKMFEYMACNKPVIVAIDGEAKEMILKSGAGLNVEPENTSQIKQAILQFYMDADLKRKAGHRGRQWVERHFSRRELIGGFYRRLDQLQQGNRRAS